MLEIMAASTTPSARVLSVTKAWTGLPLVSLRHKLQEGRLELTCPYPMHQNRLTGFIDMAKILVKDEIHCEIRETLDSGASRIMTLAQLANLAELDLEIDAADWEDKDALVEPSDTAPSSV